MVSRRDRPEPVAALRRDRHGPARRSPRHHRRLPPHRPRRAAHRTSGRPGGGGTHDVDAQARHHAAGDRVGGCREAGIRGLDDAPAAEGAAVGGQAARVGGRGPPAGRGVGFTPGRERLPQAPHPAGRADPDADGNPAVAGGPADPENHRHRPRRAPRNPRCTLRLQPVACPPGRLAGDRQRRHLPRDRAVGAVAGPVSAAAKREPGSRGHRSASRVANAPSRSPRTCTPPWCSSGARAPGSRSATKSPSPPARPPPPATNSSGTEGHHRRSHGCAALKPETGPFRLDSRVECCATVQMGLRLRSAHPRSGRRPAGCAADRGPDRRHHTGRR